MKQSGLGKWECVNKPVRCHLLSWNILVFFSGLTLLSLCVRSCIYCIEHRFSTIKDKAFKIMSVLKLFLYLYLICNKQCTHLTKTTCKILFCCSSEQATNGDLFMYALKYLLFSISTRSLHVRQEPIPCSVLSVLSDDICSTFFVKIYIHIWVQRNWRSQKKSKSDIVF